MESSDFSRMRTVVEEALQHHMNIGHTAVPDDRDFIRPWRRRLRDLTTEHTTRLTQFLESPQFDDIGSVKPHTEFVSTLTSGMASHGWMERCVAPVVSNAVVLESVERELGCTVSSLTMSNHCAMNLYLETVKKLFECDTKIHTLISELEEAKKRVESVTDLEDGGPASDELQGALYKYLQARYVSCDLESSYKEFCETYTRFIVLRNVVLGLKQCENTQGSPLCGICTTEKVTLALTPCGHVFCNNCGQKQRSQCYVCRSSVSSRLRLYFL